MGGLSWVHWALFAVVALLLFGGRGKISGIMGDAARGIRAFKDGLKEDPNGNDPIVKGGALPRQEAEKEEARVDR